MPINTTISQHVAFPYTVMFLNTIVSANIITVFKVSSSYPIVMGGKAAVISDT